MKVGDTIEHKDLGRGKIIKEITLRPDLKPALLAINDTLGLVPLENFIVCFKVDFESRTSVLIFTKDTLESKAEIVDGGVDDDVEKQPQFEKGNPVHHRRLGPGIVLDCTDIDNNFYYQVQFENGHLSPYPGVSENNLRPLPNRSTESDVDAEKSKSSMDEDVVIFTYVVDSQKRMATIEDVGSTPVQMPFDEVTLLFDRLGDGASWVLHVVETKNRTSPMVFHPGVTLFSRFSTGEKIPLNSKTGDRQFLIDLAVARERGRLVSPSEINTIVEKPRTEVSVDYVVDVTTKEVFKVTQYNLMLIEGLEDPRWKRITLKKGEGGRYFVIVELKHAEGYPSEPDSSTYSMDNPIDISVDNALRWAGMHERGEIPRSIADDKFY